jgi:hypothetical protein
MVGKLAVSLYWMWRKNAIIHRLCSSVRTRKSLDSSMVWSKSPPTLLSREFEVVIMAERAIGKMVGSDRVPPERLHANLCWR